MTPTHFAPVTIDRTAGPLRMFCANCGRTIDQARETAFSHDSAFFTYWCLPCVTRIGSADTVTKTRPGA